METQRHNMFSGAKWLWLPVPVLTDSCTIRLLIQITDIFGMTKSPVMCWLLLFHNWLSLAWWLGWQRDISAFILLHSLSYFALSYIRKVNTTNCLITFPVSKHSFPLNCITKYQHSDGNGWYWRTGGFSVEKPSHVLHNPTVQAIIRLIITDPAFKLVRFIQFQVFSTLKVRVQSFGDELTLSRLGAWSYFKIFTSHGDNWW